MTCLVGTTRPLIVRSSSIGSTSRAVATLKDLHWGQHAGGNGQECSIFLRPMFAIIRALKCAHFRGTNRDKRGQRHV
jgi:hypothetical protein